MHTNIDVDNGLRKRKIHRRSANIVTALYKVKMYKITVLILPIQIGGNFLNLYLDLQISLPRKYSSDITFLFLTKDKRFSKKENVFFVVVVQIQFLLKLDDDRDGEDE